MARCPNCGTEVAGDARYCTNCGIEHKEKPSSQEQPPLPFSPWGPPPMVMQPAGAGAATPTAEPVVGPPLSARQVSVSIAGILLFLVLVIVLGRWYHGGTSSSPTRLPVLGVVGEAVTVGDTVLGVAFTDSAKQFHKRSPKNGHFLSVGVVIGNRGEKSFLLDNAALGLDNGDDGKRYTPVMTAWGTPEELQAGKYRSHYSLPAAHAPVAGLIIFDVSSTITKPRLLVRDLKDSSSDFSGAIDLTRKKGEE